jgi:hypothetical protein
MWFRSTHKHEFYINGEVRVGKGKKYPSRGSARTKVVTVESPTRSADFVIIRERLSS